MRVGTGEHHCRSYISCGSSCLRVTVAGSAEMLLPPAVGVGESRGRTPAVGAEASREQAGGDAHPLAATPSAVQAVDKREGEGSVSSEGCMTERPGLGDHTHTSIANTKPYGPGAAQSTYSPHHQGYPGSQAAAGMEFWICRRLQVAQELWVEAAYTHHDSCCW